ncbi:MAG: nucleotidyltransferase domain-containing protein [Thermoflexia bacterium]|nr:MAG: nucleotidyltransferase domain-containing protein [Thermoflexia bacterium]
MKAVTAPGSGGWFCLVPPPGGEAGPESDIDLLVLLDRPDDYFRELRTIVDLLYSVQLESDRLISAKPAPVDDFDQGRIPLYRVAQREGVR